MTNLGKRVSDLERAARPAGELRVIYGPDWSDPAETPAAWEKRKEQARASVGENDTLIFVEYVRNWRCPESEVLL